jgi:PKD repeat protein
LKEKDQDIKIKELFRQKLEGAEIVPDPSTRSKLMRRLAFQEFLRFDPFRFNIYYSAGTLTALAILVMLLFSGPENQDQTAPLIIPPAVKKDSAIIQIMQDSGKEADTVKAKIIVPVKKIPVLIPEVVNGDDTVVKNNVRDNTNFIQSRVNKSMVNRSLFNSSSPDARKLQAGKGQHKVLFEASSTKGCMPMKVQFRVISDLYDSCMWTFGDGGYSKERNPQWIFDVEGEYKVILDLTGNDGSHEVSSVIITVYPKPQARFEIAPGNAVLPGDEIRFFNYSSNATHFSWDFGDGNTSELFEPQYQYEKSGNYNVRLVAESDEGCSDSLLIKNAFSGSGYYISFPNAFIPNSQGPSGGYYSSRSDESAQVFHPVSNGVTNYQLKIFSKHGILIFESSDINIGWDGYLNDQLSEPGVYIWKVRGSFRNGEPFIKMGDVTLLGN